MTETPEKRSYKPDGYSTVSPYLVVDGANATIGFLIRVFGAQELRRFAHSELTIPLEVDNLWSG